MKWIIKLWILVLTIYLMWIFASNFYLEAMKKNAWIFTFWEIDISKISDSINWESLQIYNWEKKSFYNWFIKSGFIDNDELYLLYYYPFYIFNTNQNNPYISVYDKYILNKYEENFSNEPYYLIYNKRENKFIFLNAQKQIIAWEKYQLNMTNLLKLDSSYKVNIENIYLETKFDLSNNKNPEYKNLLQELNNYLNLHIKQ